MRPQLTQGAERLPQYLFNDLLQQKQMGPEDPHETPLTENAAILQRLAKGIPLLERQTPTKWEHPTTYLLYDKMSSSILSPSYF